MDQLPQSFEKTTTSTTSEDSKDIYAKYLRKVEANDSDSNSDSDSDSDDEDAENIPISHQFELNPTHDKPITCLQFSRSTGRLITSSKDYSLDTYDFSKVYPNSPDPSSSITPFETNFVQTFEINQKNDKILTIPNGSSFKILDIDGEELENFNIGDKYIYDVKKTYGHVDLITSGDWNSEDSNKLITSSHDSTFRIWDLEKSKQIDVALIKSKAGKKTKVQQVKYVQNSKNVFTIDNQERVLLWDLKSNLQRPIDEIESSSYPISIQSINELQVLVRSKDDLKLYDLRNLNNPMIQRLNFATNLQRSPIVVNQNLIMTESSSSDSTSQIHILDKSDLFSTKEIPFADQILSFDWNEETNQIAIGQKNGKISILFNPEHSSGGILKTINNRPKKTIVNDTFVGQQTGYNLNELAEFNKSRKKKRPEATEGSKKKPKLVWGVTKAD